ncbi:MAG: response regulator [Vicinamibacteria bacterium]
MFCGRLLSELKPSRRAAGLSESLPSGNSDEPQATILVVDDDDDSRKLFDVLLRTGGYATAAARNGAEALKCVAQSPPDLIILDVLMPDVNGYEVAARLKASPLTATIPIIMITAKSDPETRLAGRRGIPHQTGQPNGVVVEGSQSSAAESARGSVGGAVDHAQEPGRGKEYGSESVRAALSGDRGKHQ